MKKFASVLGMKTNTLQSLINNEETDCNNSNSKSHEDANDAKDLSPNNDNSVKPKVSIYIYISTFFFLLLIAAIFIVYS